MARMTTESVRRDVEVEREAKRRGETNLEVERKKRVKVHSVF